MSGQAAGKSVAEVKRVINSIETNNQMSKGSSSGAETNYQLNKSGSKQPK